MTLIIGGRQAGLSAGCHLPRLGRPFVILEAHEGIGDVWRRRLDSLRLFSPARYDGLPGRPFPLEVASEHPTVLSGKVHGELPFRIDGRPARVIICVMCAERAVSGHPGRALGWATRRGRHESGRGGGGMSGIDDAHVSRVGAQQL